MKSLMKSPAATAFAVQSLLLLLTAAWVGLHPLSYVWASVILGGLYVGLIGVASYALRKRGGFLRLLRETAAKNRLACDKLSKEFGCGRGSVRVHVGLFVGANVALYLVAAVTAGCSPVLYFAGLLPTLMAAGWIVLTMK